MDMENEGIFADTNTEFIEQFLDTDLFDDFIAIYLNKYVFRFDYTLGNKNYFEFIKNYPDNLLVNNLLKLINNIESKDYQFRSGTHTQIFIKDYTIRSSLYERKNLVLTFWSRSFDNTFQDSFSIKEIQSYLNSLQSRFSNSDIEIIGKEIYFMLGIDNVFDTNITSNPSLISEIITQYDNNYVKKMMDKGLLSLKYFDNEHIHPPIKLLAYYLMKEPFYLELIDDSIVYFRESSSEEKKRTFSILYSILNPYKLA